MNCERAKELFSDFHEGLLENSLAETVRRHIAGCPACEHEFQGLASLYKAIPAELPQPIPPFDFSDRISRRLDLADYERKRARPRIWTFALAGAAAAVIAASLFFNSRMNVGMQANPAGIPITAGRPLSLQKVNGSYRLSYQPAQASEVRIYEGGSDFSTVPPRDARLVRSDRVAARTAYAVPLIVNDAAIAWAAADDQVVGLFFPTSGSVQTSGTLYDHLCAIASHYNVAIEAHGLKPSTERITWSFEGKSLEQALAELNLRYTVLGDSGIIRLD